MRGAAQNKEISSALQKDYVKAKNCEQENVPSVISQFLHNLPPLPSSDLTDPQDDITLPRLIEAMQNRHKIRQLMIGEYCKAADVMGSMFEKLDSSLTSTENLIHEQNGKLAEKDKVIQHNQAEIERLEKKTKIQEHKIDILEKTTKIYEDDKHLLQQELETREQRLQRELSDKRRMEQRLHSMITETQLKWERECDRRVNAMQLEMLNKLWVKDEKLKQLKAIVTETNTGDRPDPPPCKMQPRQPTGEERPPTKTSAFPSSVPFPVDNPHLSPELVPRSAHPTRAEEVEKNPRPICPVPSTSSPLSVSSTSALEQLSAEDNKPGYHSTSSGTPTRTQSPAGTSASRSRRRAGCWKRKEEEVNFPQLDLDLTERTYRTVTPVRPLHRRSCSAGGEKWVDHKPRSNIDLGTVLQPVIPNAIQMSAPSEKVLSKCDRYVLTHQEVASDGEIQTKLIKGEVIKTRGGGQAVQFTDIETLKQKLTTTPSRKRKSPEGKPASGDQSDGAWTDMKTRCSLAVGMGAGSDISPGYGHHGNTKHRKQ